MVLPWLSVFKMLAVQALARPRSPDHKSFNKGGIMAEREIEQSPTGGTRMAGSVGERSSARQQMMYDANRKSTGVAYLLWLFLGGFGAHRFYLGQTGTAAAQLVLWVLGWATLIVGVGLVLLAIVGIWVLVDAFLIPGIIREQNMRLVDRLTGER